MGIDVGINTEGRVDVPVALIQRGVQHVVASAGLVDAEISVTLLGDEEISMLQRDYLRGVHPTDVISFSLGTPDRPLGDVYVGYDQAARQAAEAGVGLDEELLRLAVHGTLHVLGHDHPTGEDRLTSPMFALQEQLLREILGPA